VATGSGKYRSIHFAHHAKIGTIDDPEYSYFEPLTFWFIIKALIGLKVFDVFSARKAFSKRETGQNYFNAWTICGVLLHATLLLGALIMGNWGLVLAWLVGVACVFPLFGALRTLLEHRHPDASSVIDYKKTDHGQYSRIFGSGLFASVFGGAGFNRHLIHHWVPSLSCTRFSEMEAFIKDTPVKNFYVTRETTYFRTFRELYGK
jgi:fatty acid desaturase